MENNGPTISAASSWIVLLLLTAAVAEDGDDCPMGQHEPAPEGAHLAGDVLWAGRPDRPYARSQYRRRVVGEGFELCTCATKRCVLKCCGLDKMYVDIKCIRKPNETLDAFTVPSSDGKNNFHLIHGKPKCPVNTTLQILKTLKNTTNYFQINENGVLEIDSDSNEHHYAPGQFCLEQYSKYDNRTLPMACLPDSITKVVKQKKTTTNESKTTTNESKTTTNVSKTFYRVLALIVSLPFLFVTFLIYALIEELRNLHGKSLMCHVGMLLVAYTGLIVDQFLGPVFMKIGVCVTLACAIQFSFLASFFWLNVMCFDLCWTFSGFRPFKGSIKQYELRKFKMYSVYAWGCSVLISAITVCVHTVSSYASSTSPYYPGLGKQNCGFNSKTAENLYFYVPISIILISNLLMFFYTARIIVKQIRDNNRIVNNRSGYKYEKERFALYLKLFIVMGVNWISEILSFQFKKSAEDDVWFFIDIINALQGVYIFLIFVCKRRVLKLLIQQLGVRLKSTETSTTPTSKTQYSNNLFKPPTSETMQLNEPRSSYINLCDDTRPDLG